MDYSKFLDDNFDPKEWINAAFRSNKDTGTSNDEVNNVIEETSQEVVSNLPRVLRDVEVVKQEAIMLQDQMKSIKQDIQKVEKDTSQSMQALLQYDTIKCRMEQTAEALQQADKWTVLSTEVEEVISAGDAELLAQKLVAMQHSLVLLAKVPDYEDRCQHLEALKNRLESLVSPAVVSAISSGSQERTKHYVKMFEDIDRLSQVYRYYEHYHKSQITSAWNKLSEEGDNSLPHSLSLFYDTVTSIFHSQLSWCSPVFKEPLKVVIQMITASLAHCEDCLSSAFSQYIESQDRDVLSSVSQLKQVTDRFAENFERVILDKKTSEDILNDPLLVELTRHLYNPYQPYLAEYKKLEWHFLKEGLASITMEDRRYIDTSISKLSDSVSQVYKLSKEVNERCLELTAGVKYAVIADLFKDYFNEYASEVRRVVTNIGEKFKNQPEGQEELDSWSMFSYGLRLVETTGEMIAEIEELDQSVVCNVLAASDKLHNTTSTPLTNFKIVHDTTAEQLSLLEQLREVVLEKQSVLTAALKVVRSLSESAHKLAFDSVFSQIALHLNGLPNMDIWISKSAGGALTTDLPTFSLSPQEYITQIGQYIMTLPQYLDPFSSDDADGGGENPAAKLAVKLALKYGRLPYTKLQDREDVHMDQIWLESVSRAAMYSYCEEILRIHEISEHATKQLVTDIEYLINVLDDIGLVPIDQLMAIRDLMKASPSEFAKTGQNLQKSVVTAVQSMRNLDL